MPAASPLEAIEVAIAEELANVEGIESVTLAPVASFNVDEDGTVTLKNVTFPTEYPGAVLSLNEDPIPITLTDRTVSPRTRKNECRVTVSVAVYARSDGSTSTAARYKAWEVGHAVYESLAGFDVTTVPLPWRSEDDERLDAVEIVPIVIDAHTHGIMLRFYAKYYLVSA